MKKMVANGDKFDLVFIDADKENYIEYYELGLQLLEKNGIILADNSLCALLYDQGSDVRSTKLHQFNQHVKNDKRVEQVVLTVREGVTLIRPVQ
jgi:predicted O-methyltransferase YrrM